MILEIYTEKNMKLRRNLPVPVAWPPVIDADRLESLVEHHVDSIVIPMESYQAAEAAGLEVDTIYRGTFTVRDIEIKVTVCPYHCKSSFDDDALHFICRMEPGWLDDEES